MFDFLLFFAYILLIIKLGAFIFERDVIEVMYDLELDVLRNALPSRGNMTVSKVSEVHKSRRHSPANEFHAKLVSELDNLLKDNKVMAPEAAALIALTATKFEIDQQVVSYTLTTRQFDKNGAAFLNKSGNTYAEGSVLRPHPRFRNLYLTAGCVLRPEQTECQICFEPMFPREATITHGTCGNSLHRHCISSWWEKQSMIHCPFDNEVIARTIDRACNHIRLSSHAV